MARPREFDETTVLEAAMNCFWTQGFEQTSVRDLAERMGITGASRRPPSPYWWKRCVTGSDRSCAGQARPAERHPGSKRSSLLRSMDRSRRVFPVAPPSGEGRSPKALRTFRAPDGGGSPAPKGYLPLPLEDHSIPDQRRQTHFRKRRNRKTGADNEQQKKPGWKDHNDVRLRVE